MELVKRISLVVTLVLAIHFVAVAAGVGYLFQSKRLDSGKLKQIRDLIFVKPDAPKPEKVHDQVDPATTQPILRLERLLEQTAGRSAAEQVDFIRTAFQTQSAVLERQRREVLDLQRQVELAQHQLTKDRQVLFGERAELEKRERDRQLLAADQGFQQALDVYNAMSTKQVKDIFKSMDEPTVVRFLQAMEPRRAARVVREFKAPDELVKAQSLLEHLRKNDLHAASAVADAAN